VELIFSLRPLLSTGHYYQATFWCTLFAFVIVLCKGFGIKGVPGSKQNSKKPFWAGGTVKWLSEKEGVNGTCSQFWVYTRNGHFWQIFLSIAQYNKYSNFVSLKTILKYCENRTMKNNFRLLKIMNMIYIYIPR